MNESQSLADDGLLSDGFDVLIDSVKRGSEDAVQQLLEKYGPHVVRVVRRRMNSQLRGRFDSQDFTQAVWASFFGHLPEIARFRRPLELVRFLSRVASNKVIDAGRRAQVRSERPVSEDTRDQYAVRDLRLMVSEPTPSQYAMAQESLDQLLQNESEGDRAIVELRRQGLTQQEIARRIGISERQVRRSLSRLSRKVIAESS